MSLFDRRDRSWPSRITAEHLSLCAAMGEHEDVEYDPDYEDHPPEYRCGECRRFDGARCGLTGLKERDYSRACEGSSKRHYRHNGLEPENTEERGLEGLKAARRAKREAEK